MSKSSSQSTPHPAPSLHSTPPAHASSSSTQPHPPSSPPPQTPFPQMSWDEYFMNIAHEVSRRSKDPSSQNGCIIVDENHRPVSFGYNGMIQGADESKMTLSERPMKYYFSVHSEMNALIFARRDLTGCTIYNRNATCENCLKHCLQAGITRFVYGELRVKSYQNAKSRSMTSLQTDEAIIRMLSALPHVQTLNITNGKTYIEDILDQYPKNSPEYHQLAQWLS